LIYVILPICCWSRLVDACAGFVVVVPVSLGVPMSSFLMSGGRKRIYRMIAIVIIAMNAAALLADWPFLIKPPSNI
jgi:hypothetical protein